MAFLRFKNDFLAHYDEVCAAVRQSGEPVYIENEDGEADMVLLSAREYHRLTQQSALQQFFAAAAQDGAAGCSKSSRPIIPPPKSGAAPFCGATASKTKASITISGKWAARRP